MRIDYYCSYCGSRAVKRDAWAEWDHESQTWTLSGDPFDHAHCDDCEGETTIATVNMETGERID